MDARRAAELQVVLEGVALPASKRQLVEYGRHEDEHAARDLAALPDREYGSLDDVGEALVAVQPRPARRDVELAREESGSTPGGDDYTRPFPRPGAVRDD